MTTGKKKSKTEDFNYNFVSDINGNSYRTIKVKGGILGANQEWFADNLNVSCFRNGDAILQAQQFNDWIEACEKGIPAWCHYEENQNLGKIYNLAAILDPRGLAPEGYLIPDYIDFSILGFNAQESEPIDTNVFAFDLERNWRLDPTGISSGALKLMGKNSWKKKGKNTLGLDIAGTGGRIGNSYNNGFGNLETQCSLWIKPSGAYFFIEDENKTYAGWIEINQLKEDLPELKFSTDSIYESLILKRPLGISTSIYEKLREIKIKKIGTTGYELIKNYYPVKQLENVDTIYFNHAISSLVDFYGTGRRDGLRSAVFANGKNQIWFSSCELNSGAYVRPFKYLNYNEKF